LIAETEDVIPVECVEEALLGIRCQCLLQVEATDFSAQHGREWRYRKVLHGVSLLGFALESDLFADRLDPPEAPAKPEDVQAALWLYGKERRCRSNTIWAVASG
jgi:hypothetical protein